MDQEALFANSAFPAKAVKHLFAPLMEDKQVDVVDASASFFEQLANGLGGGRQREDKDFGPVHIQVGVAGPIADDACWLALAARLDDQVMSAGAVGAIDERA